MPRCRDVCRFALLMMCFVAASAEAADRARIAAANIGAQSALTVVRGLVQRKVHQRKDVLRRALWGALAGAGFYQAKVEVGNGHVLTGWVLANSAASVTENAAAGRHPLGQFGYSVGPVRFRVPIASLQPNADSWVYVDFSQVEAIYLVGSIVENDQVGIRAGMIAFQRRTPYREDGAKLTTGRTLGVFPGTWTAAGQYVRTTWQHEALHAVQALQLDSLEPWLPAPFTRPSKSEPNAPKTLIRFEHYYIGLVPVLNELYTATRPYAAQWPEVESYRLADKSTPVIK